MVNDRKENENELWNYGTSNRNQIKILVMNLINNN